MGYRPPGEMEAWKRNCPIDLLERESRAQKLIDDREKQAWVRDIEVEIEDCFRFAKSSPFPSAPDWAALNYANATPEADRLLSDVAVNEFDAHQAYEQTEGHYWLNPIRTLQPDASLRA